MHTSDPTLDLTQKLPPNETLEAISQFGLGANLQDLMFTNPAQQESFWQGKDADELDHSAQTTFLSTSTKGYMEKMEDKHLSDQKCAMAKLKALQSSKPAVKFFSLYSDEDEPASSASHAGK